MVVDQSGGGLVSVKGGSRYMGTGVLNEGEIDGAAVELKSHGNVFALGINNRASLGPPEATGATVGASWSQ